jgi:hypothetical protein
MTTNPLSNRSAGGFADGLRRGSFASQATSTALLMTGRSANVRPVSGWTWN